MGDVRRTLVAVLTVFVLMGGACSSSVEPSVEPSVGPSGVDRSATLHGLSVRLQIDPPKVEPETGRTVITAYFLVKNGTARTISYAGCPFGSTTFGLLPADHPNGPLLGTSRTFCGAGTTSLSPGSSRKWFAAHFTTRSGQYRLPAGKYVAVVRFSNKAEVRKSITLAS